MPPAAPNRSSPPAAEIPTGDAPTRDTPTGETPTLEGSVAGASARRILHLDMDAFFASVEQRDRPELRGRPLAVGHDGPRGVVMAASYEARRFGVHSAMPSARARLLCPELRFVPPRLDAYREVSRLLRAVFERYTELVEPLSLDEAFLDVSRPRRGPPSGTLIARALKADIRAATGLGASAGVSYCKFLAKLASGLDKPDGLTVIEPDAAPAVIAALPVERFFGVGPVTAARLHAMGVRTGAELRALPLATLEAAFGKHGRHFHRIARGLDERPVEPHRRHKSIGCETTFARDKRGAAALEAELPPLAAATAARLRAAGLRAGGVMLKVKYHDHRLVTRRLTLPQRIGEAAPLRALAARLLHERLELQAPVRLLGVTAFDLAPPGATLQPPLFPLVEP